MRKNLFVFSRSALMAVLLACSPRGGDAVVPPVDGGGTSPDSDGDTISDSDEGKAGNTDTDGDSIPDYLDDDSDNDTLPDSFEAGDGNSDTPPVDSDSDGIPDFRDDDSDDNGILDVREGMGDTDGDGTPDSADPDDDGDGIVDTEEIGGDPSAPSDTDGDGVPDYRDEDSDGDFIRDREEGRLDNDGDGTPNYRDPDSDNDCVPDAQEAGDTDLSTPAVNNDTDLTPDFLDLDSDDDGLSDMAEDANCNGIVDPGETSRSTDDTDMDGAPDLIEVSAGTDPTDATDNPMANGDFVFLVPFEEAPSPPEDDLSFATDLRLVDIYLLLDRSGSMDGEYNSIKNNIATVIDRLACPPLGSGDPADCIAELWAGAGTIGYQNSGADAYRHLMDVQPDPSRVGPAIPARTEPGGSGTREPLHLATWSCATGMGPSAAGCSVGGGAYPARTSCSTPIPAGITGAGPLGIGYPCFRPSALPVILLATDEAPDSAGDTYHCPAQMEVINAVNAINGKIIGIAGSGISSSSATWIELAELAQGTGAVDVGGTPLVEAGADAGAADAIEAAIRTLANAVPLDISARAVDDPTDSVDAVTAFIDYLETLQTAATTDDCTDGLTEEDTTGNGHADTYRGVIPGTPVCWKLVAKQNDVVMPTMIPQLFRATIEVYGDGVTLLDTRDVFFLVPPEIEGMIPD